MFKKFTIALPLSLLLACGTLFAQTSEPLIYTVGKVFPSGATHHAYVLWQPGDPSHTFGKQFAIYRKDGTSTSASPYVKLGQTKLQTGPHAIQALLKLGGQFDNNAGSVADRINTLYAEATAQPGTQPAPPAEPGIDEAEKLAYLLNIAATDVKILERIFFLGRAHPGVYMALGHGFSIKVDPASLQTYEVREVDAGGADLRVVGRVTLDAANPTALVRTSRPFEIFHAPKAAMQEVASARDHLVTRLRWGMPDPLRRLFPHTFGFNLYRVRQAVAIANGWDNPVNFPDPAVLENMVTASIGNLNPDAKRINVLPIIATALMTEAEAADIATDSETFFLHDDNDPPDNPFANGDTFYYFAAARDIAGHPGPISAGTMVTICDRLPPVVPMIESIRNIFTSPAITDLAQLKSNQHFRIRIRQTPDLPASDAAARYLIYRWDHHTQHLTDGGNPATNLVATVAHVLGEQYVDWDDSGAGAPVITPADGSEFGKTHWYTIRAEDNAACNPKNLSGHSPPAFGVLRDRVGPSRPSGMVTRCRYHPCVHCPDQPTAVPKSSLGLPDDYQGFVVRYTRQTKLIHSLDLEIIDTNSTVQPLLFKTSRFFSVPDVLDVLVPIDVPPDAEYLIRSRAHSTSGLVSSWIECNYQNLQRTPTHVIVFPIILNVLERCNPVSDPDGGTPPPHDVDGPDGGIIGPLITLTVPIGTKEYRIYRRVGHDGAFELIDRGSGDEIPSPLPGDINHTDIAPPTAGDTECCYFGQVFDENGNGGPRTKLGCITIKSGDLGTPMLADPELLVETGGEAQLSLSWFCDPLGVDRFEIWCASDSAADPGVTSTKIGDKLDTLEGAIISSDTGSLAFCGYQTQALGGGFGNGSAEFKVTLTVPASQTLTFAVRAVGKGVYQEPAVSENARPVGPFSNTVSSTWQAPPVPGQPVIPWPALAVPNVAEVELEVANYQKGEGPFYALPRPVGGDHSAAILMGIFPSLTQAELPYEAILPGGTDPLSVLFSFRRQNIHPIPADQIEPVAPFVVYRHQLPNAAHPDAVPNLVQVSPLIDRIAFRNNSGTIRLRDKFFRFITYERAVSDDQPGYNIPIGGTFGRDLSKTTIGPPSQAVGIPYLANCNTMAFWVDPMPVVRGARYQYLIVHFTLRGEIDRVIPTNYVDQP